MTRLSQRSQRALVALSLLAVVAVWAVRAPAQDAPVYTASTGQRFSLDSSMHAVAVPPGSHAELAFSDGTPEPLWLFATTHADARQLAIADQATLQTLVDGVSSGARALLRDFTISDVKLGQADPKQRSFTFSMSAEGASLASRMLAEPEHGPTWRAVRSAGQDDKLLRCLLAELLNGASAVDASSLNQKTIPAAISCKTSLERVQRFIDYVDQRAFALSRWQLTALASTSPSGLLVLWVVAPAARAAEGSRLAQSLAAELATSQHLAWLSAARTLGVALGALLAILSLGGGIAWAAARFTGASPTLSVAAPLAVLHASALLGLCLGPSDLTPALVQLAVYVIASAWLFRPLQHWVAKHSRQGLVSGQGGLSTLEYSILFLLVVIAAIGLWHKLGDRLNNQVDTGQAELSRVLNGAIANGSTGSSNNPAHQPAPATRSAATPYPAPAAISGSTPATAASAVAPVQGQGDPAPTAGAPATQGVMDRAREYLEQSPAAQYALGLGAGVLQGYTPGGFIAPSPYAASKPFELGRGLGQMSAGIVESVAGLGMIGGGGALTAAGAPTSLTPASPLGVGMVAVGVPTVVAGTATLANGVGATLGGYGTFINAMSMSDNPPGEPPSSGGGGSGKPPSASASSKPAAAPGELTPVNGRINVGGGLEKGSASATNLNPLVPGTGGPSKGIPNHVQAGFEQIGTVFKPGSANSIISNRLPYQTVNWPQSAQGAYKVLAPGGRVSLNVWTRSADEIQSVVASFRAAGFKEVKTIGSGSGTMIFGVK